MTEIVIKAEATKNSLINTDEEREIVEQNLQTWLNQLIEKGEQDGYQINIDWDDNDAWGPSYYVKTDDSLEADLAHNWVQNLDNNNVDFWSWYN